MSLLRSRPFQALSVVALFLITYFFLFRSDGAFSPEELNSILQNKESEIVNLKKIELTAQGLTAPFLEPNSYKVKNWDISGNTMVKNHEYIRLTSDNQHQVGNMFSKLPIQAESFELELTFTIKSKSTNNLFGDGFAIWIIDKKAQIGDVFGGQNEFNGLGIFVDTYKNGKRGHFPYVNLMLGDGQTRYRKESDGFESRLAGCNARELVNPPSGSSKMRLVYIRDGYLSIDFNFNGVHEQWTNCVTLTTVQLPVIKYFGLTAETGDLSQSVDILENKMFALYKPDGSFVGSVDELESIIQEQNEIREDLEVLNEKDESTGGKNKGSNKAKKSQKRKSLTRLRKSEQRIKERERQSRLEKYGDPEATFVRRTVGKLFTGFKYLVYTVLVVLFIWAGFIIYRVQKQRRKAKTTGLLD